MHDDEKTLSQAITAKYNQYAKSKKVQYSNLVSGTLNLVDCGICHIDDSSNALSHLVDGTITTLYLSNNQLCSLEGISQRVFLNLMKLSVSNNLIRYIRCLNPLSMLTVLQILNLTGNAVSRMAYYRHEVLCICVSISTTYP